VEDRERALGSGLNERAAVQSGVLVAALAAGCWALLLWMDDEMPMAFGLWIGAWTAMMAAMMLPSASPLVLLYARRGNTADSALLMGGYLLVWAAVGLVAYEADRRVMDPGDGLVAGVLIAAGAYQFTPLKSGCLRRCRNPADFLVTHWHPGPVGALRIGMEHGAYCIGCCWTLMAVLVLVGAMALGWVAVIALAVAAEKLLPQGQALARVVGIALITAGIVVGT
jgi:predicted metal-binding membrane protein